jgi:outer membrane lipoprotein-sorting protein
VKLTPKQPSAQFKNLWLVVDPKDGHVKESIVLEPSTNNTNHFKFSNVKENKNAKHVKDSLFKFVAPKGVNVKDMNEAGKTGADGSETQ